MKFEDLKLILYSITQIIALVIMGVCAFKYDGWMLGVLFSIGGGLFGYAIKTFREKKSVPEVE